MMQSNDVEKEFETFFTELESKNLSNDEIKQILKPLIKIYRIEQMKKVFWILLGFGILYYLYNSCLEFEWFINATVRLFLIQLLPYWDWRHFYHSKCLLAQPTPVLDMSVELSQPSDTQILINPGTESENCPLCEFLDSVDKYTNVTFPEISNSHLERGLPIIIANASNIMELDELFEIVLKTPTDFLKSQPCDVFTNLMLNSFFNMDAVFHKAQSWLSTKDRWFLQLRNCQVDAIKSARRLIQKPYYYPRYLAPSYSTWILLSHNFQNDDFRHIYLSGLIIIQQLLGYLDIELQPKSPCNDKCAVLRIILEPKEHLIFPTDLWLMSYRFVQVVVDNNPNDFSSITTIMEIIWS